MQLFDRQLQISDLNIVGAQNFNFAHILAQNVGFLAQNSILLDEFLKKKTCFATVPN